MHRPPAADCRIETKGVCRHRAVSVRRARKPKCIKGAPTWPVCSVHIDPPGGATRSDTPRFWRLCRALRNLRPPKPRSACDDRDMPNKASIMLRRIPMKIRSGLASSGSRRPRKMPRAAGNARARVRHRRRRSVQGPMNHASPLTSRLPDEQQRFGLTGYRRAKCAEGWPPRRHLRRPIRNCTPLARCQASARA